MVDHIPSKERLLAEALVALEDLSFDCDDVTCTRPPTREVYNRTFGVLERIRKELGVGVAREFRPSDETNELQLPYSELEKYMYRMFEFGKAGNSASAQCECQALRIAMGWTGKGASYAPTVNG